MTHRKDKHTAGTTHAAATLTMLLTYVVCLGGCNLISGNGGNDGPTVSPQDAYREARATVLQAADSTDPETRSHAIEAISRTLGHREAAVLMDALDDRYIIVQYAGAMGLGEIAYQPAEARLEQMVNDPKVDDRVAAAGIYALHSIGNDKHAGMLARILFSPNKWSRASAATAMGKMGEPSAIGPLRAAQTDEADPAAKLAMVEALARLGDEKSQRSLEAFVRRPELDVKLTAIPVFAEMQGPHIESVLKRLAGSDHLPRVRVAAARALASRGVVTDDLYELCVEAARNPREVLVEKFGEGRDFGEQAPVQLQQLAALALGEMKRTQAVDVLYPLLDSKSGPVRVASAMAILRILGHEQTPASGDDDQESKEPLPPTPLPAGGLHTSGAIEPE